jgi:N-formylmaleamate deformylase
MHTTATDKPAGFVDDWQERHLLANGIGIHYYRTGGNKPPLILAHGVSDNGLCWRRVALALQADFDLIMVDARGHGRSDKPAAGYDYEDFAADLAAFIQEMGLGTVTIMGHSMGALTAIVTAAQHPQLVSKLILEDPPLMSDQAAAELAERFMHGAAMFSMMQEQPVAAIIQFAQQTNSDWHEMEFPAWAESKKQFASQVFAELGVAATRVDWRSLIRQLTMPALLLTADNAPRPSGPAIVTPEIAAEAAVLNPRIELAYLPGAGHNIRREQFDLFMQTIRPFLTT